MSSKKKSCRKTLVLYSSLNYYKYLATPDPYPNSQQIPITKSIFPKSLKAETYQEQTHSGPCLLCTRLQEFFNTSDLFSSWSCPWTLGMLTHFLFLNFIFVLLSQNKSECSMMEMLTFFFYFVDDASLAVFLFSFFFNIFQFFVSVVCVLLFDQLCWVFLRFGFFK